MMLNQFFRVLFRVVAISAFYAGLMVDNTTSKVWAGEALVAVASNFAEPLQKLKQEFEKISSHRILVSIGSSGKLYAQIINGAPFDVLLSADQARPKLLEEAGKIVPSSRFTYAIGRLTLWSADKNLIEWDGRKTLSTGNFATLAIANPQLAPYGRAAYETLSSLGLLENLKARIVEGQNIGQTFSFIATGNAQLGLVARSYVKSVRNKISGSYWDVPVDLYQPIRQDGVLIGGARNNPAAIAFWDFLKGQKARAIIKHFGYGLE